MQKISDQREESHGLLVFCASPTDRRLTVAPRESNEEETADGKEEDDDDDENEEEDAAKAEGETGDEKGSKSEDTSFLEPPPLPLERLALFTTGGRSIEAT